MENNDTICRTCLRLREGLCDGEKEQTACPWYKRMTNGDRIRAMTDEELAKCIHDHISCELCQFGALGQCNGYCQATFLDWLKQEVSE